MPKKSGRITLRMDPAVHQRVEKTAHALGMDLNGMLNFLIRSHLPHYEMLVEITNDPRATRLYARWLQLNPSGDFPFFAGRLPNMLPEGWDGDARGVEQFENGNFYIIDSEGDNFRQPPPSITATLRKQHLRNIRAPLSARALSHNEELPTLKSQGGRDETQSR